MAINLFKVKKYGSLLLIIFITNLMFMLGNMYYGLIGGMLFLLVGSILAVILGNIMLKNPFSDMLEGAGILLLNIDSTGILRLLTVKVLPPYIKGKMGKTPINDVFNRSTVNNLATPEINKGTAQEDGKGGLIIKLDEKKYNEGRFALFHYPCLIYNSQLKSLVTKEFLSDNEKEAFAEHKVLYLNRRIEELTSNVRDFGRYVIENLKPKESIFSNKWTWIVIGISILILIFLFAGPVIEMMGGFMGSVGSASNTAGANLGSVVPK